MIMNLGKAVTCLLVAMSLSACEKGMSSKRSETSSESSASGKHPNTVPSIAFVDTAAPPMSDNSQLPPPRTPPPAPPAPPTVQPIPPPPDALSDGRCHFHNKVMSHGKYIAGFAVPRVPAGQRCQDVAERRICNNGVLSGSYPYFSCTEDAPVSVAPPPNVNPAATSGVAICAGVAADNTGAASASAAIQTCLDRGGVIALPKGIYKIDSMLSLNRSGTVLTTQGLQGSTTQCGDSANTCAVLKAAPGYVAEAILKASPSATDITFDHINFDGNRAARSLTVAHCRAAIPLGRNVLIPNGQNTRIVFSGFFRTFCGTALGLAMGAVVPGVVIENSVFSDNGENSSTLWSDGLTIGFVSNARIDNNYFYNNSDVSLILGGGTDTVIRNNQFVQTNQRAFAAFMLTNWSSGGAVANQQWADFRRLVFSGNYLNLGDFADIGIQVGVITWGDFVPRLGWLRTMGSTISGNTIITNRQAINIAGGGTPNYPVDLGSNSVSLAGSRKTAGYTKSGIQTSFINVQNPNSDSYVRWTQSDPEVTNINWNSAY